MQTKQHHQPPQIKQDNTHYNHLTQLSTKFNEKYQ